ncbi:MAG: hypothetical protein ACD_73C00506G0001, partial [uncultured bacterium]
WNADFFCVREGNESEREKKYPVVYDLGSY